MRNYLMAFSTIDHVDRDVLSSMNSKALLMSIQVLTAAAADDQSDLLSQDLHPALDHTLPTFAETALDVGDACLHEVTSQMCL